MLPGIVSGDRASGSTPPSSRGWARSTHPWRRGTVTADGDLDLLSAGRYLGFHLLRRTRRYQLALRSRTP
jgi:hypothetical protein